MSDTRRKFDDSFKLEVVKMIKDQSKWGQMNINSAGHSGRTGSSTLVDSAAPMRTHALITPTVI